MNFANSFFLPTVNDILLPSRVFENFLPVIHQADYYTAAAGDAHHENGPGACRFVTYRCTRALPPFIIFSTSLSVAVEVSPGVVMACAPWAAPQPTQYCGSFPARNP